MDTEKNISWQSRLREIIYEFNIREIVVMKPDLPVVGKGMIRMLTIVNTAAKSYS
jgi:hypothetical protein